MAITFIQERKKQKYLILILALVILSILLVVWLGFLREKETGPLIISPILQPKKIEINWETLKSPQLKELEAFGEIPVLEGEFGKENPFLPL